MSTIKERELFVHMAKNYARGNTKPYYDMMKKYPLKFVLMKFNDGGILLIGDIGVNGGIRMAYCCKDRDKASYEIIVKRKRYHGEAILKNGISFIEFDKFYPVMTFRFGNFKVCTPPPIPWILSLKDEIDKEVLADWELDNSWAFFSDSDKNFTRWSDNDLLGKIIYDKSHS